MGTVLVFSLSLVNYVPGTVGLVFQGILAVNLLTSSSLSSNVKKTKHVY